MTEGSVVGGNGQFDVVAKHRYVRAEGGLITVVVTNNDEHADHTFHQTVAVAASEVNGQWFGFTAQRGIPHDGPVAYFRAGNEYFVPTAPSATITWGSGGTTDGKVKAYGGGLFGVFGAHTVTKLTNDWGAWNPPENVTVTLKYAPDESATSTNPVTVRFGDVAVRDTDTDTAREFTEGEQAEPVVGKFFVDNPHAAEEDFKVTVRWGGGATSPGKIVGSVPTATGTWFDVTAKGTFADEGTYPVGITVAAADGGSAVGDDRAVVEGAKLQSAGGAGTAYLHMYYYPDAPEAYYPNDYQYWCGYWGYWWYGGAQYWSWNTHQYGQVEVARFKNDNPLSSAGDFQTFVEWTSNIGTERVETYSSVGFDSATGEYVVYGSPPAWIDAAPSEGTQPISTTASVTVVEKSYANGQGYGSLGGGGLTTTRLAMTNPVTLTLEVTYANDPTPGSGSGPARPTRMRCSWRGRGSGWRGRRRSCRRTCRTRRGGRVAEHETGRGEPDPPVGESTGLRSGPTRRSARSRPHGVRNGNRRH